MKTNKNGLLAILALAVGSAFFGCVKPELAKPSMEQREITDLVDQQKRNRELIHAGAIGGYLAAEKGVALSEYLSAMDADLDKLYARHLAEERQRLSKK